MVAVTQTLTESNLALCRAHFPGMDWHTLQSSEDLTRRYQLFVGCFSGILDQWGLEIRLAVQMNGARARLRMPGLELEQSKNIQGLSAEQVLLEVKAKVLEAAIAFQFAVEGNPDGG